MFIRNVQKIFGARKFRHKNRKYFSPFAWQTAIIFHFSIVSLWHGHAACGLWSTFQRITLLIIQLSDYYDVIE